MLPAFGLMMAVGWAAFTPDGTSAAARPIALLLVQAGEPPDCAHPWAAWAHSVLGLVDARRFDECAALVGGGWRRRTALLRLALEPGSRGKPRENAARLLLLGAVDQEAVTADVLLTAPNDPVLLVDEAVFIRAPADIGVLAETAPIRGLYDRALLFRDADPAAAWRALGPIRADLPLAERLVVEEGAAPPGGAPGSALEPPSPPSQQAPPPTGVLALVREAERDHVHAEWRRIVGFVADGPGPSGAVDASARWKLALTSRLGSPRASVHSVLRGDPSAPALAAWVASLLAEEAGLTVEVRRSATGFRLQVGGEVLIVGRCGARFSGSAAPALALPSVAPDALRDEAAATVVSGLLREGDVAAARDLALGLRITRPAALLAVLSLSEAAPPLRGTAAPTPVLVRPPRKDRKARSFAPAEAAASSPGVAYEAPADGEARALVAWWAAHFGRLDAARELAALPTSGPFEQVRAAALAAAGEPGVAAAPLPDPACLAAELPWPPPAG